MSYSNLNFLEQIAPNQSFSYIQKLRGVCTWWIRQNPEQIGGVGIIAEIDEVRSIHKYLILIKS